METAWKLSAARTLPDPPTLSPWAMPPLSTRDESQDGFGCRPVYSDDCRSARCSFQGNYMDSQRLHLAHGVCGPMSLFLASSCSHAPSILARIRDGARLLRLFHRTYL